MKCKCCGEEMTAGIVLHHRCLDELLEPPKEGADNDRTETR